jgi:Rrf2 family nitric oxide-sensitive transcriptional repressor
VYRHSEHLFRLVDDMRLTTYTDYALRVLMYLATKDGGHATVSEVAACYGISRHHLVKVVHRLGALDYVSTARGKGGGVILANAPEEIFLGDVLRDFEEDTALVECFRSGGENGCRIAPACRLSGALRDALDAFFASLDRVTLADITARPAKLAELLGVKQRVRTRGSRPLRQ